MLFRIFIISFVFLFVNTNIIWADNHNPKYHHISNPKSVEKQQEVKTATPETNTEEKEETKKPEEVKPTEKKYNKYYRIAK